MCEACGPMNRLPEHLRPDLKEKMREHAEKAAARHGMTAEEIITTDRFVSRGNRARAWFVRMWEHLPLLRPGL